MKNTELFEGERAAGYDQFTDIWIPGYQYFLDCLPKLLNRTAGNELLVAGCGTGNEIEKFVQSNRKWSITGIDPSSEMLKQAEEKFKKVKDVKLIEGRVSDLDIDKKYNAATLSLVLHFLDDKGSKLGLLKDIAKRLVPGSEFVIFDITGDESQIANNLKVLKSLLPDGLDSELIDLRLTRIKNDFFIVSESRLSDLCEEAGFEKPVRFFQSSIYMGWLTKKN